MFFSPRAPLAPRAGVPGRLDLLEAELSQIHASGLSTARSQTTAPPESQHAQHLGPVVSAQEHHSMVNMYKELLLQFNELQGRHNQLLQNHGELMQALAEAVEVAGRLEAARAAAPTRALAAPALGSSEVKRPRLRHPALGVLRLDRGLASAEGGEGESPASFGYELRARGVPGLTLEAAQRGKLTEEAERRFAEGIKLLEQTGVRAITGDSGLTLCFQALARRIASVPVFMSPMVQCPVIMATFDAKDQILILTANDKTLKPQKEVLMSTCGVNVDDERFVIKGCQDVPGLGGAARGGEAALPEVVQPCIMKLAMDALAGNSRIVGILLECSELPPYADALRAVTELPVWDAVSAADFYASAYKSGSRYGVDDWHQEWELEQEVLNSPSPMGEARGRAAGIRAKSKAAAQKLKKLRKKQAPMLGVLCLDHNHPPGAGDADCTGSYDYEVLFRSVPGLTLEMAQSGMMTYQVQREFVQAIKWLESAGVCGITGDTGFMMAFQPLARDVATVPVFMSPMLQTAMISVAFDKHDKILVLTGDSKTLRPQKEMLLNECGFDIDDSRFIIVGCQDVPGLGAAARAQKADVEAITPKLIDLVQRVMREQPTSRALLLEGAELPPYADALRTATGLPVWDAITCADYFVSCRKDNPRFGFNQWQNDWEAALGDFRQAASPRASPKGWAKQGL